MSIFVDTPTRISIPKYIRSGSQTVTTAGTSVPLLSGSTTCLYVIVTAQETNTDTIWVGGFDITAGLGRPLVALQSEQFQINDVSKIYIDADVSGEGVTFIYASRTLTYLTDDDGNIVYDDDGNPVIA